MQTLWTRAAQARGSCRCPQCLTAVNGVSRRATATATRRMPRFLTSSTLWYSGIFAAAATFDAAAKMRRREQWDVAIAGVKQELESRDVRSLQMHLETQGSAFEEASAPLLSFSAGDECRTLSLEDAVALQSQSNKELKGSEATQLDFRLPGSNAEQSSENTQSHSSPESTAKVGRDESAALTSFQPIVYEMEQSEVFRDLDPERRPRWVANTGRVLSVDHLPPQSIYAPRNRKDEWLRTGPGPKKLASLQMAMEMLQLTLFLEVQRRGWSEEAAKAVPEDFARHILFDEIEQIRRMDTKISAWRELLIGSDAFLDGHVPAESDVRFCDFSRWRGRTHIKDSLATLESSLQDLFALHAKKDLSQAALYAKIAYNLSISPAPNVNTINTLLLGFRQTADRAVIDPFIAYIRQANIRTNEVTLAAILQHYITTNQRKNFVSWTELMHGKAGGLMLARSDVGIDETAQGRLVLDKRNPHKVVQLPYPTPYVFSAIVEGTMKFSGMTEALSLCRKMGTQGWGLSINGLTVLLQDCAERADWRAGSATWKQIQALKLSSRRRQGAEVLMERIKLPTFAAMLKLCSQCEKRDDFMTVWDEASRTIPDLKIQLKGLFEAGKHAAEAATHKEELEQTEQEDVPVWHDNENYFLWNDGPYCFRSVTGSTADWTETQQLNMSRLKNVETAQKQIFAPEVRPTSVERDTEISDDWERLRDVNVRDSMKVPQQATQLELDQLHGYSPPGNDLDHYEITERPFALA